MFAIFLLLDVCFLIPKKYVALISKMTRDFRLQMDRLLRLLETLFCKTSVIFLTKCQHGDDKYPEEG